MKTQYRVSYADTDQMGVVYYANYLVFFERGRTELLREAGLAYRDLETQGYMLAVKHAECDYLAPAHYDDLITIETRVGDIGAASVTLLSTVWRDDAKLAHGHVELVCIGSNGRPTRLPDNLKKILSDLILT